MCLFTGIVTLLAGIPFGHRVLVMYKLMVDNVAVNVLDQGYSIHLSASGAKIIATTLSYWFIKSMQASRSLAIVTGLSRHRWLLAASAMAPSR